MARATEAARLAAITAKIAAAAESGSAALAKYDRNYWRGRAALIRGQSTEAVVAFRAHRRRRPQTYSARIGIAIALAASGKLAAARAAFAELGLAGDLDGLCDRGWEALGDDDLSIRDIARSRLTVDDFAGSLALARLAKDRDLEAWARMKLGERKRAVALARSRRMHPETAATILIEAGELQAARPLLEQLARSDRSNWSDAGGDDRRALGWAGLACVRHDDGEYTQALVAVREARAVTPSHPGALLVEVASLAALGFGDRARTALRAIEALHPLRDVAWAGLRRSALEDQLGVPDRRRRALEDATRQFEAGDMRAAANGYATALESARAPMTVRARVLASEAGRDGALRWAITLAHLGERTRAAAIARALYAADPDHQAALRVIAWSGTLRAATTAYARGGLAPQIEGGLIPTRRPLGAFRALVAGDALTPVRQSVRGRAERLAHYGLYADALAMWSALPLAPGEPARFLAAYSANQCNDRALAWKYLAPYLKAHAEDSYYEQPIDPWILGESVAPPAQAKRLTSYIATTWKRSDTPARVRDPHLLRVRALHQQAFEAERRGDQSRSLELYLQGLEAVPEADVAGNAANQLAQLRAFDRADRWFEVVRHLLGDLDPPIRRGWELAKLASRHFEGGDHARAAVIADRAVELTNSPGDFHTLAASRSALGDRSAACTALDRGLALDPSHDQLRALRRFLSPSECHLQAPGLG